MKKRISILFLLLLTMTTVSFADVQKHVKLDNVKKTGERIVFDYFDICLKLTEDANDDIKVDVDIENTDEEKGILLFGRAYSEDELKKRQPKIKFHKDFSGSKGKRITDAYSPHIRNNIVYIEPGEKTDLLTMIFENKGGDGTLNLPVYMINYKEDRNSVPFEKNELVISKEEKVELVVEVEVKQEQGQELEQEQEKVDPNIVSEYNKLKAEYDAASFCNNEAHEPSLAEQKMELQNKIDSLKEKIDNKIETDSVYTTDSLYNEYDALKKSLDALDLSKKESDCGKHGEPNGHSCWLCSSSLEQMYKSLDKIYQEIYSSHGQDREAKKEKYYYDVRGMYRCAQQREEWQHSEYKDKIEKFYNKTMEFYKK